MKWLIGLLTLCSCTTITVNFEADGGSGAADASVWRCAATSECAQGLVCDLDNGQCLECLGNSDCTGQTPSCNTLTHRCVTCGAEVGCSLPQTCILKVEACARVCTEDSQCPGAKHGCQKRVCSTCENDSDCAGLHCNTSTGACVACVIDSHCGGGQPKCQSATGTCVRCLVKADCEGTDACLRGACIASH